MALAMAWPYVPLRELWFGQIELVHQGNDTMYQDGMRPFALALLGVPWLAYRLSRDRRDPLALLAGAALALYVYGGLSEKWSYGRLLSYAVLALHVALADAAVALEERLGRLPGGPLWRHLTPGVIALALVAASWQSAVGPTLREAHQGAPRWLSFLERHVGHRDVVITDLETCWYVPSFAGRVIAYPMQIPFVPDRAERVRAVERFIDPTTPAAERYATLARYHVRFVLLDKSRTPDWPQRLRELEPLGRVVFSSPDYALVRLDSP
jgi:hypothetical protein